MPKNKHKSVTPAFTFDKLVSTINGIHESLANQATKAINISLTLRNWLIGSYIAEYELRGTDRAAYGDQIIDKLSTELQKSSLPRCDRRELYRYRQLYRIYPQIVEATPPQFALDKKTPLVSVTENDRFPNRVFEDVFMLRV